MTKRYPLGVLLLLVAALVLTAALATSAFALPTFTDGLGTTPACDTCHTQTQVHGVPAHAAWVPPTTGKCNKCHTVSVLTPPPTSACGACHGGVGLIVVEPTHSTLGCTTCHTPAAAITSITPSHALAGASVTIAGTHFGATQGTGTVKFGTTAAIVTSWSDTSIVVTVPAALSPGVVNVTVTPNGGTASEAFSFTVDAAPAVPVVTSFAPTSGVEGATVTLTGTGFTGATAVTFNGTASTFTVVSDTKITATVPTGATTGTIAVTTPAGTGTSTTNFTVLPPGSPVITSFTPLRAGVGATVTLTGTGFTGATAVMFNGVAAATFSVVSDTTITAKVPTGATTGPIAVTTPIATGTSTTNFTVLKPTKITLKLSGLTLGVLKRGHVVTATGKVTPVRSGKVTITLQKKKAGKWVRIKAVAKTMSATGTYKWAYRAGTALSARGSYRVHTRTLKTAKYLAGQSVWKYFRVR